jgi:hypothetical protein
MQRSLARRPRRQTAKAEDITMWTQIVNLLRKLDETATNGVYLHGRCWIDDHAADTPRPHAATQHEPATTSIARTA